MDIQEIAKIEKMMEEMFIKMAEQQRAKTVAIAHRIRPDLSEDDLRDPHSFPAVTARPEYAFEDGILAGIIAAQSAVMCELRGMKD